LPSGRADLINQRRAGNGKKRRRTFAQEHDCSVRRKAVVANPVGAKGCTGTLLSSIAALTEQIAKADEQIAQLAEAKYPETKLLPQVKGVGPLIALTYVLIVETGIVLRRVVP